MIKGSKKKHKHLCNEVDFCLSLFDCHFDDQLSIICIMLGYKWEYWSLTITKTIDNYQRPVFSLGVCKHNYAKITNLWTLELNWSSKLRDNDGRKKTLSQVVVSFGTSGPFGTSKGLEIKLKYFIKKLLLSQKLGYFRRCRFSQCFKLSITLPLLLIVTK